MTEHNYAGIAFKETLRKNPDLMTVNVPEIEAKAAEHRAKMAAANPPAVEPVKVEYEKLRKQLYDLTQNAAGTKVRLEDARATVMMHEKNVKDLLKKKRAASVAMELGQERYLEHNLLTAESELQTSREALVRWQKDHTQVGQTLRAWETENGARLKELEAAI